MFHVQHMYTAEDVVFLSIEQLEICNNTYAATEFKARTYFSNVDFFLNANYPTYEKFIEKRSLKNQYSSELSEH